MSLKYLKTRIAEYIIKIKTTTAIETSAILKSRGIYKIKLITAQTIQKIL